MQDFYVCGNPAVKIVRFLRSKNKNPKRFNECWAEYQANGDYK